MNATDPVRTQRPMAATTSSFRERPVQAHLPSRLELEAKRLRVIAARDKVMCLQHARIGLNQVLAAQDKMFRYMTRHRGSDVVHLQHTLAASEGRLAQLFQVQSDM